MVDVVAYNALSEYLTLNKRYIDVLNPQPTFNFTTNQTAGFASTCSFFRGTCTLNSCVFTKYWNTIPQLETVTCEFKVCDTSGYYRCGRCCLWTVPAGVSKVQFQLWGPGGSTGTNCCCGGAPFGPTGAYASVIMDVTPGCQYTLCAGCAYCCYATQTTPGLTGGASYVTGFGLTNFCADSGKSCVCFWRCAVNSISSGCQFPTNTSCGPESCGGWNFCWDSSNDAGFVYYSYSGCTLFSGTSTSGTVYGIPGMYPIHCVGSSHQSGGFTIAAPVFGFLSQSQCCFQYTSQTCAGCCFSFLYGGANGKMGIPGQGGYASNVQGGCNACGGDSGRMGMICVRMC